MIPNNEVLDKDGDCIKCGATPQCVHSLGDSGGSSVDDFRLICPNCGEINKFISIDTYGDDIETCPWCGKSAT